MQTLQTPPDLKGYVIRMSVLQFSFVLFIQVLNWSSLSGTMSHFFWGHIPAGRPRINLPQHFTSEHMEGWSVHEYSFMLHKWGI